MIPVDPSQGPQSIDHDAAIRADKSHDIQKELDKENRKEEQQKKKNLKKSTAVSFANKDLNVDDLIDNSYATKGDKQVKASQEKVKREILRQANEEMKTMMGSIAKDDVQDSVLLSKQAQQKNNEIRRKKRIQVQKTSILGTEKTEVQKENKPQVQSAQKNIQVQLNRNLKQVKEQVEQRVIIPEKDRADTKKMYQRYLAAYTESATKNNKQKTKESKELRQALRGKGFSAKQLNGVEEKIKQTFKKELKKNIKNSFIEMAMKFSSKDKLGVMTDSLKKYDSVVSSANASGIIGEGDGFVDQVKAEAKEEMRDFLFTELDDVMMAEKAKNSTPKEIEKAFKKYDSIMNLTNSDMSKFISKFQEKAYDWGLSYFPNLDKGILDIDPNASFNQDGQKQKKQSQEEEEEIEALEEGLRQLFMQKSIVSGAFRQIEIQMKIKKVQGKMKKLGIFNKDRIKQIKEEGQSFAKIKLMNLIRESYEERAALEELKGTSFKMVTNKFKKALKGLKSLGVVVTRKELDDIRDQINNNMFSIIKEEYLKVDFYLDKNPKDVGLIKRSKSLLSILERLKEESKILEDIKSSMFSDVQTSSDSNVIEAA